MGEGCSDAGSLAYRELDGVLGFTRMAVVEISDNRTRRNTRQGIAVLPRQSIYSRLAGNEDTNDAERLCVDPTMRHVAGGRATAHGLLQRARWVALRPRS